MAIVKLQPDVNLLIKTTLPEAITEPNKSIFTSLVPETRITSLLKYVEGFPWSINYYGQILNTNNTLENYDPSTPNLTQPYYNVIDLILQVSSPIASSYSQETGITTVSGAAIAPYNIIPSVGDIFVAKVDTTEDAIFTVISVNRKTHRKDTIYEIAYNLYSYVSANPNFITTLQTRVQDTYYFNKDTNFFNRDILIKPSVKEAIDRLNNFIHTSQEYYFNTFIQRTTGSLMIPGVSDMIYDPILINFILSTVEYDNLNIKKLSLFNYSNNSFIDQPSIFNVLLTRNKSLINTINKKYKFVSSVYLNNKTRFGTPYFANIDYILFPVEPDTKIKIGNLERLSEEITDSIDVRTTNNYSLSNLTIPTLDTNLNLLHSLFEDNYYIVSKNFYDFINDPNNPNNTSISFIEFLIYKFINNEAINKEDLAIAIEKSEQWSLLHQFYLLPIMYMIIKNSI
ncbi:MAG: hypothetical protein ACD_33C00011G0002 [uncultured bacterium]|nr:MAG: hypothetical protein ACD_33C00011G0002 [uncultured bacterium]